MRLSGLLAAALAATFVSAADAAPHSADARLRAIYTVEWNWREKQFAENEDSNKPVVDHLPKVDAATQAARLAYWQKVMTQLRTIPRARLSPSEQENFDVYEPQIAALIAGWKFRNYEMPVNSDTTFWTDLGYTARQPFRTLADYKNWIAQMG